MASSDSRLFRTDAELKAFQPADREYTVRHADTPALKVRVQSSGAKFYILTYDYRGKRANLGLGGYPARPLSLATAEAHQLLADLEHLRRKGSPAGQDPASLRRAEKAAEKQARAVEQAQAAQLTFDDLADDFLEHHAKKRRKNWGQDESRIVRFLEPKLAGRAVADITRRELVQLCDGVEKNSGPGAANATRDLIRLIFNTGIRRGLIETSPAMLLDRAKETPRSRVLDDDEIRALWSATVLGERAHDILRLQLLTGARVSEMRCLKWSDVDLAREVITFRGVKQGGDHRVPMVDLAREILEARQRRHGERSVYVFPGNKPRRPITREAVKNALATHAAVLGGYTSHDTRRTVRARLGELSVEYTIAERVLGHSVGSRAAKAYDWANYLPQMRAALYRWEAALRDILAGRPVNVVPLRPVREGAA